MLSDATHFYKDILHTWRWGDKVQRRPLTRDEPTQMNHRILFSSVLFILLSKLRLWSPCLINTFCVLNGTHMRGRVRSLVQMEQQLYHYLSVHTCSLTQLDLAGNQKKKKNPKQLSSEEATKDHSPSHTCRHDEHSLQFIYIFIIFFMLDKSDVPAHTKILPMVYCGHVYSSVNIIRDIHLSQTTPSWPSPSYTSFRANAIFFFPSSFFSFFLTSVTPNFYVQCIPNLFCRTFRSSSNCSTISVAVHKDKIFVFIAPHHVMKNIRTTCELNNFYSVCGNYVLCGRENIKRTRWPMSTMRKNGTGFYPRIFRFRKPKCSSIQFFSFLCCAEKSTRESA